MVGPALGLAWLSCIGCDHVSAVAALCLAMGLNAGTYAGFQVGNGMAGDWCCWPYCRWRRFYI